MFCIFQDEWILKLSVIWINGALTNPFSTADVVIQCKNQSKVTPRHNDLTIAGLLPQLHHQPGSHDSPCITAYLWQVLCWACVCLSILLLLSCRSVWVRGWIPDELCRRLLTQAVTPSVTGWWPVAQTSSGTWHEAQPPKCVHWSFSGF